MLTSKKTKEGCSESVLYPGSMGHYHGCTKPVWKDGFCKVHHPESVDARRVKVKKPVSTIVLIDGRYTCTECGYEYSAIMGDPNVPTICECQK